MPSPRLALLLPLLLLGACGGGEEESPGGLSADEQSELNDAAAMLDNEAMAANLTDPRTNR